LVHTACKDVAGNAPTDSLVFAYYSPILKAKYQAEWTNAILHPEKKEFRIGFPTHFPAIHNHITRTITFALVEFFSQRKHDLIGDN
jgi:hypothetical protein